MLDFDTAFKNHSDWQPRVCGFGFAMVLYDNERLYWSAHSTSMSPALLYTVPIKENGAARCRGRNPLNRPSKNYALANLFSYAKQCLSQRRVEQPFVRLYEV